MKRSLRIVKWASVTAHAEVWYHVHESSHGQFITSLSWAHSQWRNWLWLPQLIYWTQNKILLTWPFVYHIKCKKNSIFFILEFLWLILLCVCVCVCAQSRPTLWDLMDCSPPGSSVYGIFQPRILEWVTISSSRGSSDPGIESVSCKSFALADRFFTTVPPGKPQWIRSINDWKLNSGWKATISYCWGSRRCPGSILSVTSPLPQVCLPHFSA